MDTLRALEGCIVYGAAVLFVSVIVGSIVQHGDTVADELHVPKLFRRDGGDQIVEGAQLVLAAEVEALEHVVSERGHLTVLAAQQFSGERRRHWDPGVRAQAVRLAAYRHARTFG